MSVCWSVVPFFSGSTQWGFFKKFLEEDILPYMLKFDKARFWKIAFVVRYSHKQDKFGPKAEYLVL